MASVLRARSCSVEEKMKKYKKQKNALLHYIYSVKPYFR
jgi:hypothetical protein